MRTRRSGARGGSSKFPAPPGAGVSGQARGTPFCFRDRLTRNNSIVRPDRDRTDDVVLAVTHDQTFANPALKAKTPFVKPPVYIDYGVRLHVGGSTFINRNCTIMDTPVADVVIGEGCNIGPNCVITGVTRELFPQASKCRSAARRGAARHGTDSSRRSAFGCCSRLSQPAEAK
jgi:acetyltransferase-like isoleucine patch superfamily enzyme